MAEIDWPTELERTPAADRERTHKFQAAIGQTTKEIVGEMGRMGVDPDASEREVESAFRELAKETHADVGGSSEEFKRVREAREVMLGG